MNAFNKMFSCFVLIFLYKRNSKLLKFDDVYKLEVVNLIRQMMNSESPIIQFSFVADHHEYNFRNKFNLRPPRANLNMKKMWVAYIGCAYGTLSLRESKLCLNQLS